MKPFDSWPVWAQATIVIPSCLALVIAALFLFGILAAFAGFGWRVASGWLP